MSRCFDLELRAWEKMPLFSILVPVFSRLLSLRNSIRDLLLCSAISIVLIGLPAPQVHAATKIFGPEISVWAKKHYKRERKRLELENREKRTRTLYEREIRKVLSLRSRAKSPSERERAENRAVEIESQIVRELEEIEGQRRAYRINAASQKRSRYDLGRVLGRELSPSEYAGNLATMVYQRGGNITLSTLADSTRSAHKPKKQASLRKKSQKRKKQEAKIQHESQSEMASPDPAAPQQIVVGLPATKPFLRISPVPPKPRPAALDLQSKCLGGEISGQDADAGGKIVCPEDESHASVTDKPVSPDDLLGSWRCDGTYQSIEDGEVQICDGFLVFLGHAANGSLRGIRDIQCQGTDSAKIAYLWAVEARIAKTEMSLRHILKRGDPPIADYLQKAVLDGDIIRSVAVESSHDATGAKWQCRKIDWAEFKSLQRERSAGSQ